MRASLGRLNMSTETHIDDHWHDLFNKLLERIAEQFEDCVDLAKRNMGANPFQFWINRHAFDFAVESFAEDLGLDLETYLTFTTVDVPTEYNDLLAKGDDEVAFEYNPGWNEYRFVTNEQLVKEADEKE